VGDPEGEAPLGGAPTLRSDVTAVTVVFVEFAGLAPPGAYGTMRACGFPDRGGHA